MSKKFKTSLRHHVVMGAVLALVAQQAHAAGVTAGQGHIAPWLENAVIAGAPSDDLSVDVAVHLKARNQGALKKLVAEVSDGRSKNYGTYVTPDQFAARFAPRAADVASVRQMLVDGGMTNISVGSNGMYVAAKATVRQLRTTFNVGQVLYNYKGRLLRANDGEPALPTAIADKILYVEGLNDTTSLRAPLLRSATSREAESKPLSRTAAMAVPVPSVTPVTPPPPVTPAPRNVTPPPVAANLPSPYCNTYSGQSVATLSTAADMYGTSIPWLICGYTPQQVRAAYGLDKVNYDGTGITVAIVDAFASPTLKVDGNRYAANHGLPALTNSNFSQIIPAGIYNVPAAQVTNAQGWWGEQSLDLAAVHGAAPGAKIVYVGSTDNDASLDEALFDTIYNRVADVVTNSYGFNGEGIDAGMAASYDQAFMASAVLGMTILFSSGDDGDLAAPNGVASGSWPATSAYVTGVGGTSLLLAKADGTKSEYGWGNYRDNLNGVTVNSVSSVTTTGLATTTASGNTFDAFVYYAGSGGGISLIEPQPAWQAAVVSSGLATTLNLASGYAVPLSAPARVSPDVAMVGDPYTGYLYGETFTIAGDPVADSGCTPISSTQEYCEESIGGTSLSSPLMAGVIAIMNQKRVEKNRPMVGFANPLFYSHRSGSTLTSSGLNQISAPTSPVSLLRGYANNLNRVRVVTINSVPFLLNTTPYAITACGYTICEGVNEVFNYTSNAADWATGTTTPAGYNDVTGLGVPWLPTLIDY